jgi:hypothetical protein
VIRFVGALLSEQTDEWAITKRYMSAESLKTPTVVEPSPEDPRIGRKSGLITRSTFTSSDTLDRDGMPR